ncbi:MULTISPECIES: PQQ-dependent sugar dehydrogenase [Pseudomonas]|uniref:Sorbosone dehydrogenase family protein n=1 Tax=Pseudomonas piscis TaxID=2614538 RepID=A0A7X1PNY1_9PSED|nr:MULTISPECIES: sorbosone dehydrogenase family protein [Pseudomonas]AZC20014.1 L-sorbosone dehydrogenase [Pseudomonas sp. CMR5c]MQA55706.1 sorbosone dehydrogenase family protein [Pseudomonas piscis]
MLKPRHTLLIAIAAGLAACGETSSLQVADGTGPNPKLPEPNPTLIPTLNIAPAIGWPEGAKPLAASGTQVSAFAENLDHPRWLYVLPNGDVLVAETNAPPKPDDSRGIRGWVAGKVMGRAGATVPSANRITLLRDADHDGVAETRSVFLENLNSPFGMTLVGNDLYVADTDKLLRFPYQSGDTRISAGATKVVDLPGGTLNHHWTKNVIASKDGSKLYVTVGSNSNVGENGLDKEEGRAAIWEVDRASGQHRLFATGLRNPNGLAWEPVSGALWTAVNERDEIGSDLVPDYITSVKDGAFYGWPFSYYGQHVDVRVKPQDPALVAKAIAPDYAVGPHTASLGLAFATGSKLPAPFTEGAFIGQHGSWNRKPHSGYKVLFVPFSGGKPQGQPIDLLSGFLDADKNAMGRPVGVVIDQQGALLVADDVGNKIWRVSAAKKP